MRSLHYIELKIIVEEYLKNYIDFYVEKFVKHKDRYVLMLRRKGQKVNIVLYPGKAIYILDEVHKEKDQFSRKVEEILKRQKLEEISVIKGERVVVFRFSKGNKIYLELFSSGNIVITDDKDKIIVALYYKDFGIRKIYPNEIYKLPPKSNVDPFELSFDEFLKLLNSSNRKDIIRFLILDLNIGRCYAEEILFRSKIDKNKKPFEISEKEANLIFNNLKSVLNERTFLRYENEYSFAKLSYLNEKPTEYKDVFSLLKEVFEAEIKQKEQREDRVINVLKEKLSEMEKIVNLVIQNKELLKYVYDSLIEKKDVNKIIQEVRLYFGKDIKIERLDKFRFRIILS